MRMRDILPQGRRDDRLVRAGPVFDHGKKPASPHTEGALVEAPAPSAGSRFALAAAALVVVTLSSPAARAACPDKALAEALMQLFDGADAGARRSAADTLARCRAVGAEGALARAARTDEDGGVRRGATRGLATLDTRAARAALSVVARVAADPAVRGDAVAALEAAKDRDGLWAVAEDAAVAPAERAWVLSRLGAPISDAERARFQALVSGSDASIARVAAEALRPPAPPPPPVVVAPPAPPATDEEEAEAPVQGPPAPPALELAPPTTLTPPAPNAWPRAPVEPLREGPRDGLPLAVGASAVAGGALFPLLSLMSGLDSPGALVLTGSAGAVIGAGTTWGLSRFGYRPTLPQAAWYATATTWGTLAGAAISASAGFTGPRARYGTIVGGELVGLGTGIWTAKALSWTGPQVVVANSFVLGAGLVGLGVERLRAPGGRPSPLVGAAVVPWMIGSAVAAREIDPTPNDLHLMFVSATAGAWTGGLVASGARGTPMWDSRAGAGGLALGAGGGYLLAAGAAAFSDVSPDRTWTSGLMLTLGNLVGRGVEKVARPDAGPRWNFGTGLGGAAFAVGTFVYQPYARFGPSAPGMGFTGLLLAPAVSYGAFAARNGWSPSDASQRTQRDGAAQAAAVLGVVTGAIASRRFNPDAGDDVTTFAFTGLGASGGLGVAKLAVGTRGTADAVGVLGGAGAGFLGGAIFSHYAKLRAPEVGAGFLGATTGAFAGALSLTLNEPLWHASRRDGAGAALGVPIGALAGGLLAHATDARGANVAAVMWSGVFGLGAGIGVGNMLPRDGQGSRDVRRSALAGTGAFMAASMLLEPKLHLADGLGPSAPPLFLEGALVGGVWGAGFGALLEGPEVGRHARGGLLAGAALGGATGLVLSKSLEPQRESYWFTLATGSLGALGGLGVAELSGTSNDERAGTATLVGSVAAFAGGAVAARALDLEKADAEAGFVGASAGALLGGLARSLGPSDEVHRSRVSWGGALLGASVGGLGGVALRQATDTDGRTVGFTALGGLDGLAAGFGVGLLADGAAGSTRAERAGALAGTGAGLVLGATLWPRLSFDEGDSSLVFGAGASAAWVGLWLPALRTARWDDVSRARMTGGALAGVGLGTIAASALVPALAIEPDLVENALWMDAVFSGAGLGAGVVASGRADAQARALLGAGTAGLLLGGALHDQIELGGDDSGWLALAALDGAWLGGVLPYALHRRDEVTSGQRLGGLAAGTLGFMGVAALSSSAVHLDGGDASLGVTGSAVGASIAGGVALLSDGIHDQRAAGLVLAGSVVGTVGGVALAPHLDFGGRAVPYGLVGATLGASEATLLAWAARGATDDQYGGAALVGAGAGATLGLAAASHPFLTAPTALASSGFAAWGAWIGAFAGAAADPRAPRISAIGMAGADAGFLAGYGLLKLDLIEPRDFGWLSLGGAAGTVVGGLAGAVFTKPSDRAPLWLGLSAGPVVGMIVGGVALPWLRTLHPVGTSWGPAPARHARASARASLAAAAADEPVERPARLKSIVAVEHCAPFFGALPTTPDAALPAPVVMGVTGLWR
jgi:hypothetical protein